MENLTKNNKEKIYLAGIYCRISVEEREKNGIYSDSIKSQIQMAKEYVTNQKNVISVDKYIDDGVSGSSFERPEFRRMLTDIDLGKINMVIVKDISRLGREHILVSYYLEKYFPQRGVRIRALLENYDSKEDLYDGMLNLKILQNDMYLQDISRKTRSVIQAKRKLGEYTAKEPPYGYIKSKKRHNHLEIDTYAAEIVRKIYQMYLDGYGCRAISKILNQEGIICPGRYKKEILQAAYPYAIGRGLWTASSINNILTNMVYTGAVILKKIEKPSYKRKERKEIPLSKQELCENAHEAIVTKQQFAQVQKMRESRRISHLYPGMSVHKYSGLLHCGKCGYRMRKGYLASRCAGYVCSSHQELGKSYCALNPIALEKIDALVAFAINQQLAFIGNELKVLENEIIGQKSLTLRQLELQKKKSEKYKIGSRKIYEQYMDEVLPKEEYLNLKTAYDDKNRQCQIEMKKLRKEVKKEYTIMEEKKKWLKEIVQNGIIGQQLGEGLLHQLIERIEIDPKEKIVIHFRFNNPRSSDGGKKRNVSDGCVL